MEEYINFDWIIGIPFREDILLSYTILGYHGKTFSLLRALGVNVFDLQDYIRKNREKILEELENKRKEYLDISDLNPECFFDKIVEDYFSIGNFKIRLENFFRSEFFIKKYGCLDRVLLRVEETKDRSIVENIIHDLFDSIRKFIDTIYARSMKIEVYTLEYEFIKGFGLSINFFIVPYQEVLLGKNIELIRKVVERSDVILIALGPEYLFPIEGKIFLTDGGIIRPNVYPKISLEKILEVCPKEPGEIHTFEWERYYMINNLRKILRGIKKPLDVIITRYDRIVEDRVPTLLVADLIDAINEDVRIPEDIEREVTKIFGRCSAKSDLIMKTRIILLYKHLGRKTFDGIVLKVSAGDEYLRRKFVRYINLSILRYGLINKVIEYIKRSSNKVREV